MSSPRTPKQGQQYQQQQFQQQQFQQQQFQQSFNSQLPPKQSLGQTTPGGSAITIVDSDDDDVVQINPQLNASSSFSFNQVIHILYR